MLYYLGDCVEQNYAKAAELYDMAADAGKVACALWARWSS